MNQSEIREFLDYCEENVRNFNVSDCEESVHCYFNDTMIGGYAGDSRTYFINYGTPEFDFLLKSFDNYKEMKKELKVIEQSKQVTKIKVYIKFKEDDIGVNKISEVKFDKSVGYIDGPEDPIYDIPVNGGFTELFNQLCIAQEEFYDVPENVEYYIDGNLFAYKTRKDLCLKFDKNFSLDLIKNNGVNKAFYFELNQDENGMYFVEKLGDSNLYINKDEKHIRNVHYYSKFETEEEALNALNYFLSDENSESTCVSEYDISVIYLDGQVYGGFVNKKMALNSQEAELFMEEYGDKIRNEDHLKLGQEKRKYKI